MVRFLMFLERDAEDEISLHKRQTQKRIKAQKPHPSAPEEIENLADDFASRATATVLAAHDEIDHLAGLATAMRHCRAKANRSHVSGKHDAA